MEPQQLIRTIRRRWRPLVLLAVVGASLGAASAAVAEDAAPAPVPTVYYDACHTLLVDSSLSRIHEVVDPNLAQTAQRVTQGDIPAQTAETLGVDAGTLQTQVRVAVRNDIQSLTVCTVNPTPAGAEAGADAFAASLIAFLEDGADTMHAERIERAAGELEIATACFTSAQAAIDAALAAGGDYDSTTSLRIDRQVCNSDLQRATSDLTSYELAGPPRVPLETLETGSAVEISESQYNAQLRRGAAGANVEMGIGDSIGTAGTTAPASTGGMEIPDGPVPRAGVGALLGAAIGFGFVVFTERLDSRLRSKSDVEATLDLPVLAEIPPLVRRDRKSTRIVSLEEPRSRTAESFRALRSALDYADRIDHDHGRAGDGAQVVLVTSAGPSEGKTTTVANLATVLAEGDRRVLAVNCDFRRPRLHRYLGGTSNPQRLNVTDVPGVQLVTQVTDNDGDATPSDVVGAQRRLVERARERFDVILLDTAPILTTNDAAELLGVADHVVLVVNASETKAESAARASELLERRGLAPLGVALVGARDVPNASDYYYSDGDPYLEPSARRRRRSTSDDVDDAVDEEALSR
ncbi:MAG: division plane positioning ATPase MipZ [Acidimicrobiales bacterium]|nr:division plane positioning ATPase MipZ [Acidimicrobiales bacterium]